MEITHLHCPACATVVIGRYHSCRFCKLSPERMSFLETFIRNRGNVKEMERELGISYWTIRRSVDELIAELGFEPQPEAADDLPQRQRQILEQLDLGQISAQDAAERLSQLRAQ
jgi:hypothetical protein